MAKHSFVFVKFIFALTDKPYCDIICIITLFRFWNNPKSECLIRRKAVKLDFMKRTKMFCLFVWGFAFHSRIFDSYRGVTITGKGVRIFTYTRHSSKGSLACHTCCDTEHPFIMVISGDPWHSNLLPNVWQWSLPDTTCFYELGLSRLRKQMCHTDKKCTII